MNQLYSNIPTSTDQESFSQCSPQKHKSKTNLKFKRKHKTHQKLFPLKLGFTYIVLHNRAFCEEIFPCQIVCPHTRLPNGPGYVSN